MAVNEREIYVGAEKSLRHAALQKRHGGRLVLSAALLEIGHGSGILMQFDEKIWIDAAEHTHAVGKLAEYDFEHVVGLCETFLHTPLFAFVLKAQPGKEQRGLVCKEFIEGALRHFQGIGDAIHRNAFDAMRLKHAHRLLYHAQAHLFFMRAADAGGLCCCSGLFFHKKLSRGLSAAKLQK